MTEKAKILLVDDEPEILEVLKGLLISEGYAVRLAQSGQQAVSLFKEKGADVVVTDIRMPGMSGLEVLRAIKALDEKTEVVVLTGHASVETAISALKNEGAFDFLTKPLNRLEDLLIAIEKAVAHRNLVLENALLLEELSRRQLHLEAYNKELRMTKRELEVSRYRYEDLYDQAPVGYLSIDIQGQIIEANQTAAALFGLHKNEMRLTPLIDYVVSSGKNDQPLDSAMLVDRMSHTTEVQMKRSNGQIFYAHLASMTIFKADGSADHMRMTVTDITDRKQVELALIESEQRYRSFVENFKGIAFCIGEDGVPIFYHGAVEETTGYRESQLVDGRPGWDELVHPEELELVQSRRGILSASDERNITHEYRVRHCNGQWHWVREHIQSLCRKNSNTHVLHGVIFDITEQKQLQSQYVESRKLDAVATMAAGIAHQFNNALAGLMGNLELLAMDLEEKSQKSRYVSPMMEMIENMAQLTKQLLAYARGGKYLPAQVSANDMVHQSISLMEHRLSEKHRIVTRLTAQSDLVIADTTQMQMVILAVVENALEAMDDGGIVTIESSIADIEKETIINANVRAPGKYLCLAITDCGCGMSKNTAHKIFDPFFTTKFIGRGLGLSAAYGIVLNHSGWMEIDTRKNRGTQMRIYLPLAHNQITASAATESGRLHKGDATVLIIEDEAMVMKAVRQLLDRLEYRVLEAPTGNAALEALRNYHGQINVALLDVRLPDLEAMDLYKKMLKIRPDLKVIVCSGYNEDGPVKKLLESGALSFLQKPFSVARLSAELKSALGSHADNDDAPSNRLQVL